MMGTSNGVILQIKNLHLRFGNIQVLCDINAEIREKEIVAIIGPNGAGKTSLLNCINGFYKPQRGEIFFENYEITGMSPERIARLGLARTFQNIELYTGLSTLDNIMAGRYIHMKRGFIEGSLYYGRAIREEVEHRRIVENIIDFLELQPVRKKIAGNLPYGIRKRVELGRALASEPKVLLLDEPMAGMNIEEKEDIARFIIDTFEGQKETYPEITVLRDGVSCIVLIEHDMGVVMDIADRIIVLDFGLKIAEGKPAEIRNNPEVIKSYLGKAV